MIKKILFNNNIDVGYVKMLFGDVQKNASILL